jgi:peroxiredoxin
MLARNKPAPKFELTELNGQPRAIGEMLADGPVLLVFYKGSCPVCQMTLPYLDRFWRAIEPNDALRIFGVSQDDARTTQRFAREFDISFPILLDTVEAGYPASNGFGITSVPSLVIVNQSGVVEWASTGFSKCDLEELGHRLHKVFFRATDNVPAFRAG